nr:helix-turn-helix domain-containing protein [Pseudarthrobacter sp. ATCC 49987]
MSDSEWDEAVRRAAVIAPLAALDVVGQGAVNDAAALLAVSRRQVYGLITRYRRGTGRVTDLVPGRSGGGRGGGRLTPPVEAVIDGLIRKRYLKRQKLSLAVVRPIDLDHGRQGQGIRPRTAHRHAHNS